MKINIKENEVKLKKKHNINATEWNKIKEKAEKKYNKQNRSNYTNKIEKNKTVTKKQYKSNRKF